MSYLKNQLVKYACATAISYYSLFPSTSNAADISLEKILQPNYKPTYTQELSRGTQTQLKIGEQLLYKNLPEIKNTTTPKIPKEDIELAIADREKERQAACQKGLIYVKCDANEGAKNIYFRNDQSRPWFSGYTLDDFDLTKEEKNEMIIDSCKYSIDRMMQPNGEIEQAKTKNKIEKLQKILKDIVNE